MLRQEDDVHPERHDVGGIGRIRIIRVRDGRRPLANKRGYGPAGHAKDETGTIVLLYPVFFHSLDKRFGMNHATLESWHPRGVFW